MPSVPSVATYFSLRSAIGNRHAGISKSHRLPVLAVIRCGQVTVFEPVDELGAAELLGFREFDLVARAGGATIGSTYCAL